MDIENPGQLSAYLERKGWCSPGENLSFRPLPGGVSNRTVLVERPGQASFVVKQALAQLRVQTEWRSDPSRSHREAQGLAWLSQLAPAGATPRLLFEDSENHLLFMEAIPQPHQNWKERLLQGLIELEYARQFGALLGQVHLRALDHKKNLAEVFEDRSFFESLRLNPYYRFAARQNASAQVFFGALIEETWSVRMSLVHGDYSPKNVLIHKERIVLLDHEVIHWGDPAFDLGFSLTHFLSKANHLPPHRDRLISAAREYWAAYRREAGTLMESPGLEARAARHTLACLLARVDGQSPLEYLTHAQRERQRQIVLRLLARAPGQIPELLERFDEQLADAP